jgi:hypothetical protein
MIIEVKPSIGRIPEWGVFIDDVLFGVSKHSCDADLAAWKLQSMFADEKPEVLNHPERRQFLLQQIEEIKKEIKKTTRK